MQWVIVGVIAFSIGVGLWWWIPRREAQRLRFAIRDAKARADVEDNYRKTIGQLLGGAAVLLGAGLAYVEFLEQQQSSHLTNISYQVAKGFEHLSSEKMVLRLSGIYALEGVMNTASEYHDIILEALCAFVRDSTTSLKGNDAPATDIQAVLSVIGRRNTHISNGIPNLSKSRIPKSNLSHADLAAAELSGADLSDANLSGANLMGANLINTDLNGANLSIVDKVYETSVTWGSVVHYGDVTNLKNANLFTAHLRGANLFRANFSGATLIGADLSGGNTNLGESDLSHASLLKANLSGTFMPGANLTGAHLSEADLSGARLNGAILVDADLNGANFSGATFYMSHPPDLSTGANLTGASLNRAKLDNADLGSTNISQKQLDDACGVNATLRSGLRLKPC